jgi:hypothetical protein
MKRTMLLAALLIAPVAAPAAALSADGASQVSRPYWLKISPPKICAALNRLRGDYRNMIVII